MGYNCLAVRAPLKNSGNQITGIIGLFFYFHETSFYKAINLINMLNISPCVKSGYTYSYVMNSKVPLSMREKECAYYLARGMTMREIGNTLKISHRTVETHIMHIKDKLNCSSRSQLIEKIIGGALYESHNCD